MGELMSIDVQSHERRVESSAGDERRAGLRHAAASLGSVTARIIGGSQVELVNVSSRGVLFECDSRLLIGARASVRLTTMDVNLIVTGRVVRSRVKGLINGALRYDAALALDHDLALAAPMASALAPLMSDQVAFESAFDSPVEAYLAESENSLAEVADGARPVTFEPTSIDMTAVEAAPELPSVEFETNAVPELAAQPAVEDEPVAFEADADIAFEPVDEFVFDDAGDPVVDATSAVSQADADAQAEAVAAIERAAAEESAGSSMFDARPFVAVVEDEPAPESMFEVTPPKPVHDASTSSFFDSQPSETYGEAPPDLPVASPFAETPAEDEVAAVVAIPDAPVLADAIAGSRADPLADPMADGSDAVDFGTDIAFEPEDAAMFEAAFDEAPVVDLHVLDAAEASAAIAEDVMAEPAIAGVAIVEPVTAEPVTAEPVIVEPILLESTADPADQDVADAAPDDSIDLPVVRPEREDRVLLQFAATVPHDLAELRRIAADNQW
jgi:hypothetical protein